jgi:trimethylamine-N-oxide reductase (cytochrome c)
VVESPVASGKSFVRYAKFREDPLLEPLGTPSGKIEIYSKNIEKIGYDDCGPHPMWCEPTERLGGPTTKYKLHVVASDPKSRLHSQLCGTKLRETYTVNGAEPCLINAKDVAERGIKDGDVNVLSMDVPTSKLGQGDCGHSVVGDVEKYTGPAVSVSVFTAPEGAE